MRRKLGWLVFLWLGIAATAWGQNTVGGGVVKPNTSQRLSTIPTDQYSTVTYFWPSVPAGTGAGWYVQQSTAAGVTMLADPPMLKFTAGTASRRMLLWESGPKSYFNPFGNSQSEATISFTVLGLDGVAASTNGWWEFIYGDTTNFVINKFPTVNVSYGVIVPGTGTANAAYAPTGKVTGFVVAGGAADTTYIAFPTAASALSSGAKFWIHANPGGGPIDFWLNDVLQASIASPVRPVDATFSGCAFWISGDAGLNVVSMSPLFVQRVLP
jgi:hypothetical protein